MADPGSLTLIATLAGAGLSAGGTILSGISANESAKVEQMQRDKQAGEARAVAQREAIQRRREARLVQSRQQAVAAASGGGASDPGVIRLMADAGAAGRYNAASALYEGEARGKAFEYAGEIARYQGKQAKLASFIDAGSTALKGVNAFADFWEGGGLPTVKKKKPLDLSPYSSVYG